jgi:hypothetical protein
MLAAAGYQLSAIGCRLSAVRLPLGEMSDCQTSDAKEPSCRIGHSERQRRISVHEVSGIKGDTYRIAGRRHTDARCLLTAGAGLRVVFASLRGGEGGYILIAGGDTTTL